jgi:putative hydrolase of the HAD superfamily
VRQLLVFDADDTLWENNVLFERTFAAFRTWLAHPTLDESALRAVLHEVEHATIAVHGYGTLSFLHSLRALFERLRERSATDAEVAEIQGFGAALLRGDMELVPGVAETLAELSSRHELVLLTKGQQAEQQRKIDASTLAHHFASTHIVAEKREQTYRDLVAGLGADPATAWMIGNSPRSDILPARAAGLRAVFIPNPWTWELEHAEIPDDDGVLHLDRLTDLTRHF